jgi:cell division septation protein DedD
LRVVALETDDGFHEIQLTGKQLVFLFMAATVVSVVIFLCGVLVGRGVQMDQLADASEQARVESDDDISARPIRDGQAGIPLPALPPAVEAATPPPPVNEPTGEPPAAAPSKPDPVAPVVEPRPSPPPPAAPPPSAAPPTTAAPKPTPASPPPPQTKPAPTPAASVPRPAASTAKPAPPPGPGGWQVQLAAYKSRGEADAYVRRLAAKGYKGFVTMAPGGANMFRVRLGPYSSRADADAAAARVQKSEGFGPWVVPPGQ